MHGALRLIGLSGLLFLAACQFPAVTEEPAPSPALGSGTINDIIPDRIEEDLPPDPAASAPQEKIEERLLPGGILEIGSAEAPVALLLFTNHACRYCQDFHLTLLPLLQSEYVRKGTLRIDLVPFGMKKYQDSESSAISVFCAGLQSKGLAMHDLLFSTRTTPALLRLKLQEMGLDQNIVEACLLGAEGKNAYATGQSMARSLQVTVVPTYFINGEKFTGLPSIADLRGQIEEALE